MNTFEHFYNRIKNAKASIDASSTSEERDSAKAAYRDICKEINSWGILFGRIFREYENSRDNGNDILDIEELVDDKDVKSLVGIMKEHGIKQFTFSSTWSSSVETAWLFQESGCKLEGIVELNGRIIGWGSTEHEKRHGYLFRVSL